MRYEFSLPTKADQVPTGSDWLHEVKYDGYRMTGHPRSCQRIRKAGLLSDRAKTLRHLGL